jgi:predicted ester cyclase
MSADENKTIVCRFLEQIWDNADLTVMDEILADDYVGHDPSAPGGELRGREALKAVMQQVHAGLPGVTITIHEVLGEGELTAVRFTVHGAHRGELFGFAASGREVAVESILIQRHANARIAEAWLVRDMLGLLQQIGAAPTPDVAPVGATS